MMMALCVVLIYNTDTFLHLYYLDLCNRRCAVNIRSSPLEIVVVIPTVEKGG